MPTSNSRGAVDQIAAAAAEDVEIAGVRIALQALLNRKRQALHAAAHVGVAGESVTTGAAARGDVASPALLAASSEAPMRILDEIKAPDPVGAGGGIKSE